MAPSNSIFFWWFIWWGLYLMCSSFGVLWTCSVVTLLEILWRQNGASCIWAFICCCYTFWQIPRQVFLFFFFEEPIFALYVRRLFTKHLWIVKEVAGHQDMRGHFHHSMSYSVEFLENICVFLLLDFCKLVPFWTPHPCCWYYWICSIICKITCDVMPPYDYLCCGILHNSSKIFQICFPTEIIAPSGRWQWVLMYTTQCVVIRNTGVFSSTIDKAQTKELHESCRSCAMTVDKWCSSWSLTGKQSPTVVSSHIAQCWLPQVGCFH